MKEVLCSVSNAISNVKALTGLTVKIKVNRGRNKIEIINGIVENAYPNIFTVRKNNGDLCSFSYADIVSGNVRFLK